MKRVLIPTLIIIVFLVGLLLVSTATEIPKNLGETQKQKEDVIQPPKSIEKEDSSIKHTATEMPKNLGETQKQKEDVIQPPKSIEKEDSSIKHIEHPDVMDLDIITLRNNLDVLIATGQVTIVTVPITSVDDVSRIRDTGVIVMTQESNYVVIIGDQEKIAAVKSLGFALRAPVERDHKMRPIRVWVNDVKQIPQIQQIVSDFWPIEQIPGYVYGGAFDFEIQILRDKGYDIKLGH